MTLLKLSYLLQHTRARSSVHLLFTWWNPVWEPTRYVRLVCSSKVLPRGVISIEKRKIIKIKVELCYCYRGLVDCWMGKQLMTAMEWMYEAGRLWVAIWILQEMWMLGGHILHESECRMRKYTRIGLHKTGSWDMNVGSVVNASKNSWWSNRVNRMFAT